MIRINLLVQRQGVASKKAIDTRNFLVATAVAIAVVVAAGMGVGWVMDNQIDDLTRQKRMVETQLDTLKKKAAEIANYEADRKAFEAKIAVIKELRTNQSQPVMLVDQLATNLPDRVWLTRIDAKGDDLTIVGRAMGNSDIVEMMERMKNVQVITSLQLVESRRISEANLSAYEFTLTGRLTHAGEAG